MNSLMLYGKLLQFADDTSYYLTYSNVKNAQKLLNDYTSKLSDFFKSWKLKLNEEKTTLLHILGRLIKRHKALFP